MENNYLTSGDLAMWETRAPRMYDYGSGYHRKGASGAAATGIALGAAGLGIAVFGGMALAFGLNSASKARARGAENQANANAKSIEVLANLMSRDTARQDAINIDVQQTQRAMASALGTGGSASSNALATAEALALLNNQSNGINSAVGGCNYLRVARVSGSRLCGCDTCEG